MEQEKEYEDYENKRNKIVAQFNRLVDWLDNHYHMRLNSFIDDIRYDRYRENAQFLRNIRNLVEHNSSEYFVIKEATIKRIEDFVDLVTSSCDSKMIPTKNLFVAKPGDPVLPCLKELQEHNYSYLPILDENNVCVEVFSAYILMSFACLEKSIDADTTFEDIYTALHNKGLKGTYKFMSVKSPFIDVINTFKVTSEFHLDVVLVTEDGSADAPLLGMITIWDLQ